MSCEQIQEDFVPYLLGELSSDEAWCIERHLSEGCARCREDFNTIREAIGLVFEAVPASDLTAERQRSVVRHALHATQPSCSNSYAPALSALTDSLSTGPRVASSVLLLQALLAVAAGFFLVLGAQAFLRSGQPDERTMSELNVPRLDDSPQEAEAIPSERPVQQRANRLAGDPELLPGSHDAVHFVSLKAQPVQTALIGYFLADPFSGELHVVGQILPQARQAPRRNQRFSLTITTDQTRSDEPLQVDDNGGFKLIVPLPQHLIRDISLQVAEGSN